MKYNLESVDSQKIAQTMTNGKADYTRDKCCYAISQDGKLAL